MEVGELWAYRISTSATKFHEVEVMSIGAKRPPRVKVRFVDDEWEGETRWVSPARLEVVWESVDAHRAEVQAIADVYKASRPNPVEAEAADTIMMESLDIERVAWIPSSSQGVTEVRDLGLLAEATGIEESELLSPPIASDGGYIYLPWMTTRLIATTLAVRNVDVLMAYVDSREEKARIESIVGHEVPAWVGPDIPDLTGLEALRRFEKNEKPVLAYIREWCGHPLAGPKSAAELERELSRVAGIAIRAIDGMRRLRSVREADAFLAELMDPYSAMEGQTGRIDTDERRRLGSVSGHYEWVYVPSDDRAS